MTQTVVPLGFGESLDIHRGALEPHSCSGHGKVASLGDGASAGAVRSAALPHVHHATASRVVKGEVREGACLVAG